MSNDDADCFVTERQSAIDAFNRIMALTEHDSPIWRVAAEEASVLAHASRRERGQITPELDALRKVAEAVEAALAEGLGHDECTMPTGDLSDAIAVWRRLADAKETP